MVLEIHPSSRVVLSTCTTQSNAHRISNSTKANDLQESASEQPKSFNGEPGRIRTFSNTIWKRTPLASRDSDSWLSSRANMEFAPTRAVEEAGRLELPRVLTPVVFKTMCSADLHRFHWRSRSDSNRTYFRLQRKPMPSGSRSFGVHVKILVSKF
jgi:hypothetical protein